MGKKDYRRAFAAAKRELGDLLKRRERIDKRIATLKPILNDLAALCEAKTDQEFVQTVSPKDTKSFGITDLVRLALKREIGPLTPIEIRNQVLFLRPDLSKQSNLLASVHTVLKRLVKSDEVDEVPALGGKKAYRWISDVARVLSRLEHVEWGAGFKE